MSRIGRMPIEIPAGVTVTYDNHHMNVKGPKGELSRDLHPDMNITVEGNTITVARPSDNKAHRSLHGLTRALVANMVTGVSEGFTKTLEINGVGYRAAKQGNKIRVIILCSEFAFSCCFRFFLSFYAWFFVVFTFSYFRQNTRFLAGAFESTKSTFKRFVFTDFDFRHLYPSLQK